jgi:ankyrin repeat protein
MATGIEGAAAVVGFIGLTAQVFDGCIKGFVLLSTARNLGRDANLLRCMLDWEQFRLEHWAEKVGLRQADAIADESLNWNLVNITLTHIRDLVNDTKSLKIKYGLVLIEEAQTPAIAPDGDSVLASRNTFKKLFNSAEVATSVAAARVVQSKNSAAKKLSWAAFDRENFQRLVNDISCLSQRLYDALDMSIHAQMRASINVLLEQVTAQENALPQLNVLQELSLRLHSLEKLQNEYNSVAATTSETVRQKLNGLLCDAILKADTDRIRSLIDEGADLAALDSDTWPPLVIAVMEGNLDVIQLLLDKGADPLVGASDGMLPHHFAAEYGRQEVFELLIRHNSAIIGLKENRRQRTALVIAATAGHQSIVRFILEQNEPLSSSNGWQALLNAVQNSRKNIVEILAPRMDIDINYYSPSNNTTVLDAAAKRGPEILQIVLDRNDINIDTQICDGKTALFTALTYSHYTEFRLLLDNNANPQIADEDGMTPLIFAARTGSTDIVESLLLKQQQQRQHGNKGLLLEQADHDGNTALIWASRKGHVKTVRLLLANGANVKHTNKLGRTALCEAATNGEKINAKLLLKHGAEIDVQDNSGNTPLALAAVGKHDAVVRLLLENKADTTIADENEETPFEKVRDMHIDEVMKVFKGFLSI